MSVDQSIPAFEPKLVPAEGMHRYTDGRVSGVLEIGDGWAVIYEWSSSFEGQGHTLEALRWLRDQGAISVTAFNMGMLPVEGETLSQHAAYWVHMQSLGFVQELVDDDGEVFLLPVHEAVEVQAKAEPETAPRKNQSGRKHSSSMEPGF